MTNNDIAHLTLEHLKALRNDFADFRAETRERLDRVDLRLTIIEQSVGNLYKRYLDTNARRGVFSLDADTILRIKLADGSGVTNGFSFWFGQR